MDERANRSGTTDKGKVENAMTYFVTAGVEGPLQMKIHEMLRINFRRARLEKCFLIAWRRELGRNTVRRPSAKGFKPSFDNYNRSESTRRSRKQACESIQK